MARPKPQEPNVPLTVSIPVSLKQEFFALCVAQDLQASQVVRAYIRQYIAEQKARVSHVQGE